MKTVFLTIGLVFAIFLKDFVACQLQFGSGNEPPIENSGVVNTDNDTSSNNDSNDNNDTGFNLRRSETNSFKKGLLATTTLSKL